MLHKITHGHDAHYEHSVRISTKTLELACNDGKRHVLLAASGSVATIDLVRIIEGLSTHKNLSIRLIFTGSALRKQPTLSAVAYLPNIDAVYTDKRGASILYIMLYNANTIAKIDITGTVNRVKKKIVIRHPVTDKQIKILKEKWGNKNSWIEVLRLIKKELACGDIKESAIISWKKIIEVIKGKISVGN
ncbi:hypothetical protein BKA56DRAFT_638761 [Ilyonectria sp. MPI-CAGE-AT-0026]|nr:hypothetical protein BKA56DRAFT_638761 [Ilyonectria sp. MPI-CAGE-AT-0026]